MKKKLASILMVAAMVVTMLTGCGEKVTAESLLENAFPDKDYVEYTITMDIEMGYAMSGFSMDMKMAADMDVKSTKDVAHMDGVVSVELLGMSQDEEMESYIVVDDDVRTTYTYDFENGYWTYTEEEYDEKDGGLWPKIDVDNFEDLELEETDDGYVVTGLLKNSEDAFTVGNSAMDMSSFIEGMNDVDILVTFTFDEDKVLESYQVVFDVDEDETYEIDGTGEVSVSKMEVTMEFKKFSDKDLEVPDDVVDNAIDSSIIEDEFEDDYDDEYDDEEDDYTTTDWGSGKYCTAVSADYIVVTVDGVGFVLGEFTYQDFVDNTYFYLDDYYYKEGDTLEIESGAYESLDFYNGDSEYAYLYFLNDTNATLDIKDCYVAGINYYTYTSSPSFTVCGVAGGATLEEAIAVLGEPYEATTYEYDDGSTYDYLYYYLDNDYSSGIELDFTDGVLTDFSVYRDLY